MYVRSSVGVIVCVCVCVGVCVCMCVFVCVCPRAIKRVNRANFVEGEMCQC